MNLLNQFIVSTIRIFPKALIKRFALRYIAGENLDDAVRVLKELNSKNIMGTVDVLGENVLTEEESLRAVMGCEQVLRAIRDHRLDANLSVKLTQAGMKIDKGFCHSNISRLLEIARGYNNFLRIDMEDSSTTEGTLRLYEKLRSEGFENLGVVIQANMRRSEEDVKRLIPRRANIRLCKGAYVEPQSIAFQDREEIRLNFLTLLKLLLEERCYVGIATHDDFLINSSFQSVRELNLRRTDYEFQMLYGVKIKLGERIVSDGHRLRTYVPFGQEWYAYSLRRFKENPQIARYVLRALLTQNS